MKAVDAAQGLEAYFIRQMLSEMTKHEGAGQFGDLLNEALGDAIASAGGIGIARELAPQLGGAEGGGAGGVGPDLESKIAAVRAHQPRAVPVAGTITSRYGARIDPIDGHRGEHHGVDVAAPIGTPVAAASAGTVTRVEKESGYGNVVVVDHGGGFETRYAHLDSMTVQIGQRVQAGEQLGTVGTTGRSTGPHLHFEARRNGEPINPESMVATWRR